MEFAYTFNTYTITAEAHPTEGGTVTGGGTYNNGNPVTLTATPNEGYYFDHWKKGDEVMSAGATYSFNATEDATYTAYFQPYTNSYEKEILANKWYAISSPVHNTTGGDETVASVANLTTGAYDLFRYDEPTGTWENMKTTSNNSILERGHGYIYRRSDNATLTFYGEYNTGDFTRQSNAPAQCPDDNLKGFNLIGNPYPHVIYQGVGFPAEGFAEGWYELLGNGCWYAHSGIDPIGVGQGALVQATPGSGHDYSSLVFTDNANAPSSKATPTTPLTFAVSNGTYEDVAHALLKRGEGLPKIGHLESCAPALSIPMEGRRYAIAMLGSDCEAFELAFRGERGTYTLSLDAQPTTLDYCHLIDRLAESDIDLRSQRYTFDATSDDANRFLVRLRPAPDVAAVDDFAYWNGSAWVVSGEGILQLFDITGRQLYSHAIRDSRHEIQRSVFPRAGVYILRLGEKSQRIVVW